MSLAHDQALIDAVADRIEAARQAKVDAMATRLEEAQRRRARETPNWRLTTRLLGNYGRH